MKKLIMSATLVAMVATLACSGAGLNTVERTAELSPGMTYQEFHTVMGQPDSSEFVDQFWVLNYTLHENWKGWVPWYFAFDRHTRELVFWYEDEAAYHAQQAQYLQMWNSMYGDQYGSIDGSGGGGSGEGGSGSSGEGGYYDSGYDGSDWFTDADRQFEADSAGYPGGAYENPDSSYYDSSTYSYDD